MTRSCAALGLAGALVLSLVASSAHAQVERPSFGGLFVQVQDMLVGAEPFQTVAFGDGSCSIGIDPAGELTGLIEKDPFGFRLMGGGDGTGMRLLFGDTDDCAVEVQPAIRGLLLRDPIIRILPPLRTPPLPPMLIFGPADDCQIFVDPTAGGMRFSDPAGFRFLNPRGVPAVVEIPGGVLAFGPNCSIGIDPQLTGIVEKDPGGLRLLGQDGRGCILTFGTTDLCRILVDPTREDFGLIFTDPKRFLFEAPDAPGKAQVVVDGTLFANVVEPSSRQLKENIRPIENALDAVKQLRGVRFDWKKEVREAGGTDLGFVAEEVAAVVSEAATYDDNHNVTGVKYGKLVALAVEGIKAQQQQIEAQQKLIAELQREVATLRSER